MNITNNIIYNNNIDNDTTNIININSNNNDNNDNINNTNNNNTRNNNNNNNNKNDNNSNNSANTTLPEKCSVHCRDVLRNIATQMASSVLNHKIN